MSDVIPFGRKPPGPPDDPPAGDDVWVCGNCGSVHYRLHRDGTAACASCGTLATAIDSGWRETLADDAEAPEGDTREIVDLGSADLAKARVMSRAKLPDCYAVIVIRTDGTVSAWADQGEPTDEQRAWVKKHTAIAAALILGEPSPPTPK